MKKFIISIEIIEVIEDGEIKDTMFVKKFYEMIKETKVLKRFTQGYNELTEFIKEELINGDLYKS